MPGPALTCSRRGRFVYRSRSILGRAVQGNLPHQSELKRLAKRERHPVAVGAGGSAEEPT